MDFVLRVFLCLYHTIVFEGVHLSQWNRFFCFYAFQGIEAFDLLGGHMLGCGFWPSGCCVFFLCKLGKLLLKVPTLRENPASSEP